MRRCRFVLLISLALVSVLFLCGGKQGRTAAAFAHSRLQFEQAAMQVLERGTTQGVECPKGVRSVQLWTGSDGRETVVEFLCGAGGWGSSTKYWGVNYVVNDVPVGFQGVGMEYWKKEGSGTRFYEVEGDNTCYVERLEKNWYYFDMKF